MSLNDSTRMKQGRHGEPGVTGRLGTLQGIVGTGYPNRSQTDITDLHWAKRWNIWFSEILSALLLHDLMHKKWKEIQNKTRKRGWNSFKLQTSLSTEAPQSLRQKQLFLVGFGCWFPPSPQLSADLSRDRDKPRGAQHTQGHTSITEVYAASVAPGLPVLFS